MSRAPRQSQEPPLTDPTTGRRLCGAAKSHGGICKSPILYANGRCKVHGGPSRVGAQSGTYIDGKHSILMRSIPEKLRPMALESVNHPNRLAMDEHRAILTSMLIDSMGKWDQHASALWPKLRELWNAYLSEAGRGESADKERIRTLAGEIQNTINRGTGDFFARNESRAIIQDIRKVNEAERKRLVDAQLMMSADQVYMFVATILEDINEVVTDKTMLGDLQQRFARRLGAHQERQRALAS